MDKVLKLLKELCYHCENNLNECNKGCAFRSLSNEYCEEYEKLKKAIENESNISNMIIGLFVKKEDLVKQCDILFDNGYSYLIIKKEREYLVDEFNTTCLDLKYFIEPHIGE